MTIEASIIADSTSQEGIRLTTMQLRYPRFIHAEFMTHRTFSRNASSSRAIPVERMIADLRRDPAMPVYWGGHQAGMQAAAELTGVELSAARIEWLEGMEAAIRCAEHMRFHGLHKQIANRVLEPWAHINVVVTATDWDNFYELRCHPDAQPEIRVLAEAMRDAQTASSPSLLAPGEWHLPYVGAEERVNLGVEVARKVSVARCARVSYLTHDGQRPDAASDLKLYDRLVGARPLHASPAEHQATPDRRYPVAINGEPWGHRHLWGNLRGWRQFRKVLEEDA